MVNPIVDPSSTYMPTPTPLHHPSHQMALSPANVMGPMTDVLDDDDDVTVVTSNRSSDRQSGRDLREHSHAPISPPPGFGPGLGGNQYAALATDDEDKKVPHKPLVQQRGSSIH